MLIDVSYEPLSSFGLNAQYTLVQLAIQAACFSRPCFRMFQPGKVVVGDTYIESCFSR
jgi:hypothetical protein